MLPSPTSPVWLASRMALTIRTQAIGDAIDVLLGVDTGEQCATGSQSLSEISYPRSAFFRVDATRQRKFKRHADYQQDHGKIRCSYWACAKSSRHWCCVISRLGTQDVVVRPMLYPCEKSEKGGLEDHFCEIATNNCFCLG